MTACQESVRLGAYLLGALDPEERSALEAHIATCPYCREDLLTMAPLPGLLRHTPFEELEETAKAAESPTPPLPPRSRSTHPSSSGRGPEGVPVHALPGQRHRRPRRRVLVSAGLALGAAAAVAGAWVYSGGAHSSPSTPPAAAVWTAQNPATRVTASAALWPEAWGTQVDLKLGNLPSGITCRLVVHARDGRTETAGTWGSGYSAQADVPASTSISPSDIQALDIVDGGGNVLVQVEG
jgi:hypothetical protein